MHAALSIIVFAVLLGAAALVYANEKDPLDYPIRQYLLLLAVAMLGGIVSWYGKVKAGSVQTWNLMHLIGELTTSAFAGLMAFWVCAYINTPPLLMAALVGVAGHMGARAIVLFERWAAKRFPSVEPVVDSKHGKL